MRPAEVQVQFNQSICRVLDSTPTSITCVTSGLQGNMTAGAPYPLALAASQVCSTVQPLVRPRMHAVCLHSRNVSRAACSLLAVAGILWSVPCLHLQLTSSPCSILYCRALCCRPLRGPPSHLTPASHLSCPQSARPGAQQREAHT